jgi:pimeloyl-ACP methyl ester carboxylesterase
VFVDTPLQYVEARDGKDLDAKARRCSRSRCYLQLVPIAEMDGVHIHYELAGEGYPAVVTAGGRNGMEGVASLALRLRPDLRVLEWDRRNTGASDLYLGKSSEQVQWADDLADLLRLLDLAPAWLLGGSAGARVSYLTAIRHPDVARGLVLWSVSGGAYGSQNLGYMYHVPFVNAALLGGMEAVADTAFFAERIATNSANAEVLLSMNPDDFVEAILTWNEDFVPGPDNPAIAVTAEQLRTIHAPTLIFEGNDLVHAAQASRDVHALIEDSVLVPCAWSTNEFNDRYVGKVAEPINALYSRQAPTILEFIASREGSTNA